MTRYRQCIAICFVCSLTLAGSHLDAEDWFNWRGPEMQGRASGSNYPTTWSTSENVAWKVTLPGPGNSTPIVVGDRVFVTCADESGKSRGLLAFDRQSGEIEWQRQVEFTDEELTHRTNPQCSPSPVSDGERVIVWHGSAGLYCYDLEGDEIWARELGVFEHFWGIGSSPVIHEGKIILSAGPGLLAFIAAFDIDTGEEIWRTEYDDLPSEKIDEFRGSWSTPVIDDSVSPATLYLSLPNRLVALDPTNGNEVWRCEGLSPLSYTSPLFNEEMVVAMCGYGGPAIGVQRGGQGDVTETHRAWMTEEKNPQRVGSGVIRDGHIYIYNESGVAWCIHAASGAVLWKERLGGKSWSSMVMADGVAYISNMDGITFVLRVSPEGCEVVAENDIHEMVRGSLAFSDGQIFLRGYETLYCFEQQ